MQQDLSAICHALKLTPAQDLPGQAEDILYSVAKTQDTFDLPIAHNDNDVWGIPLRAISFPTWSSGSSVTPKVIDGTQAPEGWVRHEYVCIKLTPELYYLTDGGYFAKVRHVDWDTAVNNNCISIGNADYGWIFYEDDFWWYCGQSSKDQFCCALRGSGSFTTSGIMVIQYDGQGRHDAYLNAIMPGRYNYTEYTPFWYYSSNGNDTTYATYTTVAGTSPYSGWFMNAGSRATTKKFDLSKIQHGDNNGITLTVNTYMAPLMIKNNTSGTQITVGTYGGFWTQVAAINNPGTH